MYFLNELKKNNINVDDSIARLGGKEALYIAICQKFLQDTNFDQLQKSIRSKDYKSSRIHVHTLKGIAAYLGFTKLEEICRAIMEQFINNETPVINKEITELSVEYNKIITILKSYNL